ncbi:hypothetical protein [Neptuniibacter sp. QD48_11]|uniref:hypothetical protein n=1 Tax=unclassified Neptuniibacter TaxID=2630693 RepID=UPI0039F575A1
MKVFAVVLVSLALAACSSGDDSFSIAREWGYLPITERDHFEKKKQCSQKFYSSKYYRYADVEPFSLEEAEITGMSKQHYLGDTCLLATITSRVYVAKELRHKSYYRINVEVPMLSENRPSQGVIFSRVLQENEVGDFFKGKSISEVVEYLPESRRVKFTINTKSFSYVLPAL